VGGRFHARVLELPGAGFMVTLVDEEVLGVRVYDESSGIVIDVSRDFYEGVVVGEEEALKLLEEAEILILVGPRIVRLAIERGYVNPDSVLRVKGVEYVQVFKIAY